MPELDLTQYHILHTFGLIFTNLNEILTVGYTDALRMNHMTYIKSIAIYKTDCKYTVRTAMGKKRDRNDTASESRQ